jgi:hypothetical protein
MDIEKISISLRALDGELHMGRLSFDEHEPDSRLLLAWDGGSLSATGSDYFEAFIAIRRKLAQHELVPLCYGASRNVWPKGILRGMNGGLKAFRMTLGQPARTQDVEYIFDSGPDVDPCTPEEQQAFFQQWLASLPK